MIHHPTGCARIRSPKYYRVLPLLAITLLFILIVLAVCPDAGRADADNGWASLWKNDISTARSEFERVLKENDKDLWARRGLVVSYLSSGYDRDVIEQLEKLASLDDADAMDYLLAMWVYKSILTSGKDEKKFFNICEKLTKNKSTAMLDRRAILDGLITFSMSLGNIDKTDETAKKLNRLNTWSILGPFDNTSMSGHMKDFIDPSSPNMNIAYIGKAGQSFSWQKITVLDWRRILTFENFFERSTAITAYAGCDFEIKERGQYILSLSNGGAYSIVLDGTEIARSEEVNVQHEYIHLQVEFNAGRHSLLVKASHDEYAPSIAVSLSAIDGNEPKDIKYSFLTAKTPAGHKGVMSLPVPVMQRIRKMLEEDPMDARAVYWNLLGLSYFGCTEEIRDFAPAVSEGFPSSGVLLWTAGRILANSDDSARARILFLKSVEADSENVQGLQFQAGEKIRRKMYSESDSLLNYILKKSPQCVTSRSTLIQSYWSRGLVDEAVSMAIEMEEEYPTFTSPLEILAEYYETIGDKGEARKYRRRTVELMSKTNVTFKKVLKAIEEEDFGEAAKQWEKINKLFPDYPEGYVYFAESKFKDGKAEEGYKLAQKAAEHFRYSWIAQYYLGQIEYAISAQTSSHRPKAINYLERAVALRPGDFETRDVLSELKKEKPIRDILPGIDLDAVRNQPIKASDYPGESACVLLDEHRLIIFQDGTRYVERAIVINVFNEKGVEDFSTLSTGVNVFYNDLELKSARTIKPNGDEYEARLAMGTVSFQSVSPGDVLELHFGTVSWSPGKLNHEFWNSHTFQWYVPCKKSRYSIYIPPKRMFSSRLHNVPADLSVETSKKDVDPFELHCWTMNDIPALKNEVYSPDVSDMAVWLDISSVPDWGAVIQWYSDLSNYPSRKDKRVEEKAQELTSKAGSRAEKIEALYNFVANQVQYQDVLFQYSGQIPESAPRVLRTMLGDCKDKVCLLRSMLSSIEVESYFVLVSPVNYGMTSTLPSPKFNHAILAIPDGDGYWFLDPTAKGMSMNQLPSSLRGSEALVIRPDSMGLTTIPMPDPAEEFVKIETTVIVEPSGRYNIQRVECISSATLVSDLVNALMDASQEDRDEYLEIALGVSLVGFDLLKSDWQGLEAGSDSVVVTYELEIDNAVTQGNMKLAMIPWKSFVGPLFGTLVASLERTEPLALFGLQINETEDVRIEFPSGWRLASLPESGEFSCQYGEGGFTYKTRGSEVLASRKIVINGLIIPVEHYASFREFLVDVIREQNDNRIVLQ